MSLPHDDIDPDGLLEYSVVFTDRSLNHMSAHFVDAMQQLLTILRDTYRAHTSVVVPGGGTYAMESVARRLASGRRTLVVRNGLFSFRWSQILEAGGISDDVTVLTARPASDDPQAAWAPVPVEEVTDAILARRPELVFAPHVETAAGMILPDDYVRALADAAHEVGALLVLDCIASGAIWVDMAELGVDVLISAPQKGWSGTPCAGYVMLNETARAAVEAGTPTSFALDLARWMQIADDYRDGKASYHATMPTDSLLHNLAQMVETRGRGLDRMRDAQLELGDRVRALLADHGFASVAASEFAAPGVVVVHTTDPQLRSGTAFKEQGLQIAAGVPLHCGEGDDFSTFRLGLFGLDKLGDVDGTVDRLRTALEAIRG